MLLVACEMSDLAVSSVINGEASVSSGIAFAMFDVLFVMLVMH